MAEQFLSGTFSWYSKQKGFGVIEGKDGKEYYAYEADLSHGVIPSTGLRVRFQIKSSETYIGSRIAVNIQADGFKAPSLREKNAAQSLQEAAEEALRLKRERAQEKETAPSKHLPKDRRVDHATFSRGVIAKPSGGLPSLQSPKEVTPLREVPSVPPVRSSIGDYIRRLASDVREILYAEGWENDRIYYYDAPTTPSTAPQSLTIDPRVTEAFRTTSGITNFYSHQVETREALLRGRNVIISTPTASGKTEAYNPTILEHLLKNPKATALYIFPLVALGFDQTERLRKLNQALPKSDQLQIGISNSSVDADEKYQMKRANNRIVVTTPDSLHYIFLPNPYSNWQSFYKNLQYIVLDEAHLYKGVFGSNMANIVRRLLIRCRQEGNPRFPQIIISSATVRHPEQLAEQLTGRPKEEFTLIDQSGAPGIGRHFLVTRSDIHDLDTLCTELLDVETTDARTGQKRPVRTLVFLRSINETKRSVERLRQYLRQTGQGHRNSQVEAYYSENRDKGEILQRLRNGEVRCLFTTTALMAGIDIGGLDISIVKNFPRLVMDARQMFGRAGRAGEGAAIFIANRRDPFDQFYFERPAHLFTGPTEDVIANPENPQLLTAHLKCAARTLSDSRKGKEGPLSHQWAELFGPMGKDLLNFYTGKGVFRSQGGYYYFEQEVPNENDPLQNIRAMQTVMYTLVNAANGHETLEEKREATAYRDAHPEAILWINGEYYRVVELDQDNRQIKCVPHAENAQRTQGVEERDVEIVPDGNIKVPNLTRKLGGGVVLKSGRVNVTTSVNKYLQYKTETVMQCRNQRCRTNSSNLNLKRCEKCNSAVRVKQIEKVEKETKLEENPPLATHIKTRATWLEFPLVLKQKFERDFWPRWKSENEDDLESPAIPNFTYAVHSVEHAILKAFPDRIRCDQDEIGSIYQLDTNNLAARLFVYDNFHGGLGLCDEFANDPYHVLEGALEVIERCTCNDDPGCPVCLTSFGCHNFNTQLSKLAGRYLLHLLLEIDPAPVLQALEEYVLLQFPPSAIVRSSEIPKNS